jgi:hypothetical protein
MKMRKLQGEGQTLGPFTAIRTSRKVWPKFWWGDGGMITWRHSLNCEETLLVITHSHLFIHGFKLDPLEGFFCSSLPDIATIPPGQPHTAAPHSSTIAFSQQLFPQSTPTSSSNHPHFIPFQVFIFWTVHRVPSLLAPLYKSCTQLQNCRNEWKGF